MTSYYKPKTKKICHTDYIKYIVPINCDEVVVITKHALHREDTCMSCLYDISSPCDPHPYHIPSHHMVNAGEAYWLNKTQLCTGYTIGNVFRPVFNYSREKQAFKVREYIITMGKIHTTSARNHLYKQELMKLHNKKLPEVIVEHISNYAWDIMLLL